MTDAIVIPGYKIVRQLGRGGMASVYLAIQQSFEREVALKVMSPLFNSDPSFSIRFMREARIVAHIHHASIVPVFDVGEHGGHHYLSMEYLPGGDLKQRVQGGLRDAVFAIDVCCALSSVLDLAHRKGFVHRDIKPENILFREDGTPVLTDFGIARAIDSGTSLTVAGMLVGTPSYMSPEQVKGLELDGRSDLYSLGIVFYEMLTGAVPFRADSMLSLALKHLTEPLPQLPVEHAAYQPFLDRLAAKERDARLATGAEVIKALRQVADAQALPEQTVIRSPRDIDTSASAAAIRIRKQAVWVPKLPGFDASLLSRARTAAATYARAMAKQVAKLSQLLPFDRRWLTRAGAAAAAHAKSAAAMLKLVRLPEFDRRWVPWASVAAIAIILAGVGFTQLTKDEQAAPKSTSVATPEPSASAQTLPGGESNEGADASTATAETPAQQIAPETAAAESGESADTEKASKDAEDAAFKARVAQLIERNKRLDEQRRRREAEEVAQQSEIRELLAKAKSEYARGALLEPAGDSAADHYREVLRLQPQQGEALAGMQRIVNILVAEAERTTLAGDGKSTGRLIAQIRSIQPEHPKLADLQAGLVKLESTPPDLTRRQQTDLDKAARYIAKANEYLARTPMDLRMADAATDQYDRASAAAPLAPGLPYLRERIIVAYAVAAQTELNSDEEKRALKVISLARKRNWFSPDLEQLESRMKTPTAQR